MRKFLVPAALAGLIAGLSPVLAQDREHHDQGGAPQGEQHAQPHGAPAPHGGPAPRPAAARPAAQAQPQRGGPPRGEARGPQEARPAANNAMRGPEQRPAPNNAMRANRPSPNNNAVRGPQGRPSPANANRGGGAGRDFSSVHNYHENFSASRRFHGPAYRPPSGYYARRWTWGMTLPGLFWARQYWLTDYTVYDLPPPPFGAIWVRVGSDALLIDQTSGMIIEVDYGVFY